MRRTLLVTSVAGGALAALLAGTAAVATTSTATPAAPSTQTCSADCTGTGTGARSGNAPMRGTANGSGNGNRQVRGNGSGNTQMRGDASGTHTDLPASGTLTAAQKSTLAGMAEEEKLAHDVYVALAASTGDRRFTRIAASELQHLSAVRTLLARYGIADPTAGMAEGRFTSAGTASLYATLVAQGKVSPAAALEVGRTIERRDIADLAAAGSGVTAPDVVKVYASLSAASQRHLRAFGG
jgi:hypothetical protein